MDVSALDAIDVHTHVHRSVADVTPEGAQALEAMAAYFKTEAAADTVDGLARYYRDRNMAAVTYTVDVKDRPVRVSSEEVAERAAANADVIIPFASVDPARGPAGVRAAKRLIDEHHVRGFKFHPRPVPVPCAASRPDLWPAAGTWCRTTSTTPGVWRASPPAAGRISRSGTHRSARPGRPARRVPLDLPGLSLGYVQLRRAGRHAGHEMTTATTSVSDLDVGALAQDAVSRGYLSSSCYLISVEAGFGLWQGGAGLATRSFSVDLKAQP